MVLLPCLANRCRIGRRFNRSVTMANGNTFEVLGVVSVPVDLHSKVKVIPGIDGETILGVDFCKDMDSVEFVR